MSRKNPDLEPDWRLVALGVAHELRGSLQIIATSAYTAKQSAGDEKALTRIEKHAHRAQRILEDLLALTAKTPALTTLACSLGDLAQLARGDITTSATWIDLAPEHPLRVHPGLFARVLAILYENAGQAHPETVTITTEAAIDGDAWSKVVVRDDGPGVPTHLRGSLFEAGVTGRSGGTGVGLALARYICHAHGGSLTLEDGAAGATFVIRVPR